MHGELRLWDLTINIGFLFPIMQYFYGELGKDDSQRVRGKFNICGKIPTVNIDLYIFIRSSTT